MLNPCINTAIFFYFFSFGIIGALKYCQEDLFQVGRCGPNATNDCVKEFFKKFGAMALKCSCITNSTLTDATELAETAHTCRCFLPCQGPAQPSSLIPLPNGAPTNT